MPGYSKTITLDGIRYNIFRLRWGNSNDPESMQGILVRISSLMGDAASQVVNLESKSDLAKMAMRIMGRLDSPEIQTMLKAFGDATTVTEPPNQEKTLSMEQQNLWWSDHPQHFTRWIAESLRVNYADFFAGLMSVAEDLEKELDTKKDKKRES